MQDKNTFIDSVELVQKELIQKKACTYKSHYIRKVMKKECGMSYKKVVPITFAGNSTRNLILR